MLQRRTCGLELICFISCALFGGDAPKADAPAPRKLSVAVSNLPNETPPSKDAVIFMTQFHQINAFAFQKLEKEFGPARMDSLVQQHELLEFDGSKLERVNLIGLISKEPVAYKYFKVKDPGKSIPFSTGAARVLGAKPVERKNETRPLTDFETRAIAEIRKGRDIVIEADNPRIPAPKDVHESILKKSGKPIYAVATLKANKNCMECHEVKEGTVLGAFSYRVGAKFIEDAIPTPKKKDEPKQTGSSGDDPVEKDSRK